MALSADAQALLELLLAKGQTYEDISLAARRARGRGARPRPRRSDRAGWRRPRPQRRRSPTGSWARPIRSAAPTRPATSARTPRTTALAAKLIAALRGLAPEADLPGSRASRAAAAFAAPRRLRLRRAPTAAAGRAARRRGPPEPSRLSSLDPGSPPHVRARAAPGPCCWSGGPGVTGVFGGDDDSAASVASADSTTTTTDAPSENIQTVPLEPVGGGDAEGTATLRDRRRLAGFRRRSTSANLEPAPNGPGLRLLAAGLRGPGPSADPVPGRSGRQLLRADPDRELPDAARRPHAVRRRLAVAAQAAPRRRSKPPWTTGTPVIPYTGESIMRGEVSPRAAPAAGRRSGRAGRRRGRDGDSGP